MNSTNVILILVKMFSEEDHADKFMQGEIFARRLSWFRKLEGDAQRGDELEAAIVNQSENIRIVLEPTNIETGEVEEVIIPPENLASNPVVTVDHFDNLHVFAWPHKLDHEQRCIMEQNTKHVEGQLHGQETATAHGSLQVSYCVGSS